MRESELLQHIYKRSKDLGAHVVVGPGDDTAVLQTANGDKLLLTVDQLIEGRHFRPFPTTPIDLIARKAIARNVSDIAAMAGAPTAALAAAAIPDNFKHADELFDAMAKWAVHWGCPLIGGDISGTDGPLSLSVTVLGQPHATRGPALRSTAKPGDAVYVTGNLGGSLQPDGLGRHLTFEPRLQEATWLAETLGHDLHAMIDLSDGLGIDAGRVALASGVGFELDAPAVPLNDGVKDWRRAVADGEDHELCFTAPAERSVPAACPQTRTPITRIGRVVNGQGCVVIEGTTTTDVSHQGWDHGQN